MLRHIGIHINNQQEIEDFYVQVLGFKEFDRFELRETIAHEVFGTDQPVIVARLKQFSLTLELLVHPGYENKSLGHIALEYWKAAEVLDTAAKAGYPIVQFAKENGSLARFLRDKTGNLFEIKEINLL